MKQAWWKALVGKLAATASALLFLVLVPAAAAGQLPVWAAVVLGIAGLTILNGACGMLLPPQEEGGACDRAGPVRSSCGWCAAAVRPES